MKAKQIKIENVNTIEEVLDSYNMNWIAEPQDMITVAGVNVISHKAIVRSDINSVIGVVGNRYMPVQNAEAFAFMDVLVQQHKAKYDSLYEIAGGSKIIVQAKIDRDIEVKKGDIISSYITMINSFDGSTPFKCYFTPVRLCCQKSIDK